MTQTDVNELRTVFAELTAIHGWASLQTPRSLTLALTGRVGAVASALQFVAEEAVGSDSVTPDLRGDLADCLVYLVTLGDALGVDVLDEAISRIAAAVEASPPHPATH